MHNYSQNIANKMVTPILLQKLLTQWRFKEQKVVFTNGCFDLLHTGHLELLIQAKALGHQLIVGINSDQSIGRLKGSNRPIKNEAARMFQMACLLMVDAVIVFDEDTPLELIKAIQPNVLVKGGDYNIDTIVGAKEVMANGGSVEIIKIVDGYSTTAIIEKSKTT
jgi:rfaE bifunctional protein nucleotidyltransferase chain/domain